MKFLTYQIMKCLNCQSLPEKCECCGKIIEIFCPLCHDSGGKIICASGCVCKCHVQYLNQLINK